MVARAACKVAFGVDLPVSDFLGTFESEIVGTVVAEQFVGLVDLEDAISAASERAGHRVSEAATHYMGDAYENLASFIEKQRSDSAGSLFVEHTEQMRLCDDVEGQRVWVSLRNAPKWNCRLEKRIPTAPCVQGGEIPPGAQGGTKVLPGLSDNRLGGERTVVDLCAVGQVGTGGDLMGNCKDASVGTIGVGDSPVKPVSNSSGGCCVVS